MPYTQRDIVKIKARIPNIDGDSHPFLILSCEKVNSHESERSYIGVMITHSTKRDKFSFPLTQIMVDGNIGNAPAQIRLHMIVKFLESSISSDATRHVGKMKKIDFKQVLDQIRDYVMCID
jgi:hypothetical protein